MRLSRDWLAASLSVNTLGRVWSARSAMFCVSPLSRHKAKPPSATAISTMVTKPAMILREMVQLLMSYFQFWRGRQREGAVFQEDFFDVEKSFDTTLDGSQA